MTRCSCCALIPAWLNDMVPPSVVTGMAPRRHVALLHERSPLAERAEAERLHLPDDLEGERIVELGDVDVGPAEPAMRNAAASGTGSDHPGGESVVALHVPHRRHPVRGAEAVAVTPEDEDRRPAAMAGDVGTGQDEAAAALGRHGALEEMERVRDHPRRAGCRRE